MGSVSVPLVAKYRGQYRRVDRPATSYPSQARHGRSVTIGYGFFFVIALLDAWPDAYINASDVYKIFNNPILAGPLRFDMDTNVKYLKRAINNASTGYGVGTIREGATGQNIRPRLLNRFIGSPAPHAEIPTPDSEDEVEQARKELTAVYASRAIDLNVIAGHIADALRQDDRI
jgi:hypothetical protein